MDIYYCMITITNGHKNTLTSLLSPLHFKTFFTKSIPFWSQKLKKKTLKIIYNFDVSYRLCTYFHRFCPFYMKYHNAHEIVSDFIDKQIVCALW
jgi:hypothetical protein